MTKGNPKSRHPNQKVNWNFSEIKLNNHPKYATQPPNETHLSFYPNLLPKQNPPFHPKTPPKKTKNMRDLARGGYLIHADASFVLRRVGVVIVLFLFPHSDVRLSFIFRPEREGGGLKGGRRESEGMRWRGEEIIELVF